MARKGFDLAALAREQLGAGASCTVEAVRDIPVALIDANAGNFYARSDIDELAANIELLGLIHPVAVKQGEGERWTLIDGERRFQAVRLLGWETIRAVVHQPASDVFEELMLISANMQQRKMTSADLSKQAERYTECLAALKRSGVEIPGRLRKAVAEAFDVSEARLGRLAAIRKGLISELLEKFDGNEMNESTAYAFSRLDAAAQRSLADEFDAPAWRIETVRNGFDKIRDASCPDGTPCCHLHERVKVLFDSGYARCSACCLSCGAQCFCKSACPAAEEAVRKNREALAADADEEQTRDEETAQKDQPDDPVICKHERSTGWDWRDGGRELPEPVGVVCCWGDCGFRTIGASDYAAARELFPRQYDWWCVPVPPEYVSKMDTETDGD